MANERILVVEDESIVALDLESKLEERGYRVVGLATTGRDAIKRAVREKPDLILMDVKLDGEMDGIDAAMEIRKKADIPVIYLTAFADDTIIKRARITEPGGYIVKPYLEDTLHATIQMALARTPKERKLKWQVQWFTHGLNHIDSGMVTTDAGGKITFMNLAGKKMAGWEHKAVAGKKVETVMQLESADSRGTIENPVHDAIRRQASVSLSHCVLIQFGSGRKIPVSLHAEPIQNEQKSFTGAVLVIDLFQSAQTRSAPRKRKGRPADISAPAGKLRALTRNGKADGTSQPATMTEKQYEESAGVIMEEVEMNSGECEVYLTVFRDSLRNNHEDSFKYLAEPLFAALRLFHSYYFDIVDLRQTFPEKDFTPADNVMYQFTRVFTDAHLALEGYLWKREEKFTSSAEEKFLFDWTDASREISGGKHDLSALKKLRDQLSQYTGKVLQDLKHTLDSENLITHTGGIVEQVDVIKAHPIRGLAILVAIAVIVQRFEEADSLFARLESASRELGLLLDEHIT